MLLLCININFCSSSEVLYTLLLHTLGLNEIYLWFRFPYLPCFFSVLPLNINLLLDVKYLKIGTFSDFGAIFFVKFFLWNVLTK